MLSSNTVAHTPATPPSGQEAVFGNELLNQTLHNPHPPDSAPGSRTQSYLPGNPPCVWSVGKTTEVCQLILKSSHICPILYPRRLTSPSAPYPPKTPHPPSFHRWLLHNKQHLVLISSKTKTTQGGEEGRDEGRWEESGERLLRRKTFREKQDVKRKKEGLHFSLSVQLEVFDRPGVRMWVWIRMNSVTLTFSYNIICCF